MTFEGLSDFFLICSAYGWKDNSKGLKIQIFPIFLGGKIKPKICPQANCNALSISVYFRQSTCRAQNVYLYYSDGNTFFIKVVPMGVYYDISKFEPNWIYIETLGLPTPSLVQKNRFFQRR
ncbi:hypothetical protein ACE6H2_002135 [Prunus campanulata]